MIVMFPFFLFLLVRADDNSIPRLCNASDSVDEDYGGAYVSEGLQDFQTSAYYVSLDVYSLTSTQTLHILPKFKTYQQSSDYSCGVACAIMAMNYVNNTDVGDECDLYLEMNTSSLGTDPVVLTDVLKAHNYDAETNANADDPDEEFEEFTAFKDFVKDAIDRGEVLIMLSNDWGGHYEIIIGYDTMGTDYEDDDVLIVADPYDTTDHHQDGYTVWSAWRFYSIWHFTTVHVGPTSYSSTYIKVRPFPPPTPQKQESASDGRLRTERTPLSSAVDPESLIEHKCNASDTVADDYGGAYPSEVDSKDISSSVYFKQVNAYSLTSSGTLHILARFKTYQQSSDYSCGVACAIMAMNHVNRTDVGRECDLYEEMKTSPRGTDPVVLASTMAAHGYKVTTNAQDANRDTVFETFAAFKDFVIDAIDKGEVLIVLSNDWGGHYEIIVGYDTMGTDYEDDDVIIMADPYDTSDHRQDGYTVWGAWRFYALWHSIPWTYVDADPGVAPIPYSSTYIKVSAPTIADGAGAPARVGARSVVVLVVALLVFIAESVL